MKKSLLFGFAALLLLLVFDVGMTLNTAAQLREGQPDRGGGGHPH